MADTDQTSKADRSSVHQRNAPAAAKNPEDGILLGDPQIAPAGKFETAGNGVAGDGGNDGLGEKETGGSHRGGPFGIQPIGLPGGNGLEVCPRAEMASFPKKHGHAHPIVSIEFEEGFVE
jgi:hypothetical protein